MTKHSGKTVIKISIRRFVANTWIRSFNTKLKDLTSIYSRRIPFNQIMFPSSKNKYLCGKKNQKDFVEQMLYVTALIFAQRPRKLHGKIKKISDLLLKERAIF